ncbi:helix-turn-helix domain-containing protein [Edaphobacter albus]|uniref:helix-turn-helix domain-containing protein n=1 Tax=Edaphobacter sp. 4G125 TaxID=2763071 RepID=UPI0016477F4C|nr:helix-turn-helix domain-containing protein [Edaphobacter sp. 4G125]QNI37362.1 helix-turn-helix domain-containing protein [Edaphobacter sp. 4G125]
MTQLDGFPLPHSASDGIRVATSNDADDHAANLTRWKQTYDQLAPGRFQGILREFWLGPQMQVFEETTSHALRQSCLVWKGASWFGIPVSDGLCGRIGARLLDRVDIAVRPGGRAFELVTPASFRILGVVIDTEHLLKYIAEMEHVDLKISALESEVLRPCAKARQHLTNSLAVVFKTGELYLENQNVQESLREALLSLIAEACTAGTSPETPSLTLMGRYRLMHRVRDFVLDHKDEPISIPRLCRTFGVSRRTLQYAFHEVCGVSPNAYLRVLRLNGVRRALRTAIPGTQGVQDLAAEWGFWNPSQFACDYKKLFGERPSDSLLRSAHIYSFAESR